MEKEENLLPIEEAEPRAWLIDALRDKGSSHPESRKLLMGWMMEQELKVGMTPEDQIRIIMNEADLFLEAGLTADARETIKQAFEYAEYISDSLRDEILSTLEQLEKEKPPKE